MARRPFAISFALSLATAALVYPAVKIPPVPRRLAEAGTRPECRSSLTEPGFLILPPANPAQFIASICTQKRRLSAKYPPYDAAVSVRNAHHIGENLRRGRTGDAEHGPTPVL